MKGEEGGEGQAACQEVVVIGDGRHATMYSCTQELPLETVDHTGKFSVGSTTQNEKGLNFVDEHSASQEGT